MNEAVGEQQGKRGSGHQLGKQQTKEDLPPHPLRTSLLLTPSFPGTLTAVSIRLHCQGQDHPPLAASSALLPALVSDLVYRNRQDHLISPDHLDGIERHHELLA